MADKISIYATRDIEHIYKNLSSKANILKKYGIDIKLYSKQAGEFKLLECVNIKEFNENSSALLRKYIAASVADLIISRWIKRIIWNIIYVNYRSLKNNDKKELYKRTLEMLQQRFLTFSNLRNEVVKKLFNHFSANNRLNIDGFLRFRLKEINEELKDFVDTVAEEFLLEREYDDFIELLKYFVNMQKPKISKVNVVLYRSGKFQILDNEYKKIDNDNLEYLIMDFADNDLTNEDLLISALITIAPEEIKLHLPDYVSFSFIETIKKIFNNRVDICSGCSNCMHIRQKKS